MSWGPAEAEREEGGFAEVEEEPVRPERADGLVVRVVVVLGRGRQQEGPALAEEEPRRLAEQPRSGRL